MSRCFPYPPPGYCRNGATYEALIESIKLQKETEKTKTERKKEKKAKKEKKEKRQKEKRNRGDEIKSQNNTNGDSCRLLQKASDCTEAQIKKTKAAAAEVFEKSDLTEEHGLSIGLHQPSYSSDSTQNSNKRKRDDACSFTDGSTVHGKGKSIKILLLKKHKGSDSSNFYADASSNACPSALLSSNSDRSLVSGIKNKSVPATTGRENRIQTKSNPNTEGTKISDLNRLHIGRIQSAPSSVKPVNSFGSTRPKQQPILSFGRQVLPPVRLEHEIPGSSDELRQVDEQLLHSGRQQQLAPSHHVTLYPVTNRMSTSSASGKRSNNEIAASRNDGLTSLKKQKQDSQKVGPTRTEKKMLKKHAKYEKLLGNWFPPVFQARVPDDEDWLSGSKTSNSSISKGEVETCRQLVAPWQPCARFLAEAGIHAMPYTVPF